MNRQPPAWYAYAAIIRRVARTTLGVILVMLGLMALFTPLTPGSWLVPIGLEVLGLRILLEKRIRAWAIAHPNSRAACVALRFVSWRPRGLVTRWRRRLSRSQTPGVESRGAIDADKSPCGEYETRKVVVAGEPQDKTAPPKNEGE